MDKFYHQTKVAIKKDKRLAPSSEQLYSSTTVQGQSAIYGVLCVSSLMLSSILVERVQINENVNLNQTNSSNPEILIHEDKIHVLLCVGGFLMGATDGAACLAGFFAAKKWFYEKPICLFLVSCLGALFSSCICLIFVVLDVCYFRVTQSWSLVGFFGALAGLGVVWAAWTCRVAFKGVVNYAESGRINSNLNAIEQFERK